MKIKELLLLLFLSCVAFTAISAVSFSNTELKTTHSLEQIDADSDFSDQEEFVFNAEFDEDDDAKDSFIQLKGIHFIRECLNCLTNHQPLIACTKEFLKPPCWV